MAEMVIYENVQKEVDVFFESNKDNTVVIEQFAELLTAFFLIGKKETNLDHIDKCLQEIIEEIYYLKSDEVESIYFYSIKKLDSNLEIGYLLHFLPDDKTTEFTKKILKYLKKKSHLKEEVFREILYNDNQDRMLRFKAYYILFTFHHDKKNVSRCRDLVDSFQDDFSYFPLWHYTNSQIRYQEEKGRDDADLRQAIASAGRCIEIYENDDRYDSNYPGIYHNFSELVFYASELGDHTSFLENYEKALERIEKAKNINPKFAKYYYTHGRLLMAHCREISMQEAKREYDKAEFLINKAIDLEDSSRNDYAIKIVDYETALLRCKTERKLKEIDIALASAHDNQNKTIEVQKQTEGLIKESQVLKEELEGQKKETLELLGFFSGIISLIVVTSQVVLNLDIVSASVIMLLFLGSIILAFSFMHFIILNGARKPSKTIVGFVTFGIVLIMVAIAMAIVCKFYYKI